MGCPQSSGDRRFRRGDSDLGRAKVSAQIGRGVVTGTRTDRSAGGVEAPDRQRCILGPISADAGAARGRHDQTRLDPPLYGVATRGGASLYAAKLGYGE